LTAVPQDITVQQQQLRSDVLVGTFVYEGYSHMDFVWDKNAKHKRDVVELLRKYVPSK
jgi:hypothetical protein